MSNQNLTIRRPTPAEADEALRFYASGGAGRQPSPAVLEEINAAVRKGTWQPDHQMLARRGDTIVGSVPYFTSPSRTAVIVFPSIAPDEPADTAAKLVKTAVNSAVQEGVKLCIALIPKRFPHGGIPFLSAGFLRIAVLANMESRSLPPQPPASDLKWITYDKTTRHRFADTYAATLQGTLDCSDLPRVQTPAEVLEGHKLAGEFRPDLWFLAIERDTEIGCVLINQLRKPTDFCLVYLGVVPDHRRRHYGEILLRKAMSHARAAGATKISLSVDEQNLPALKIYEHLGFRHTDAILLYAFSTASPD